MTTRAMAAQPVPFDPELDAELRATRAGKDLPLPVSMAALPAARERAASMAMPLDKALAARDVRYEERTIPGPEGAPDVEISVIAPAKSAGHAPGMLSMHGGGLVVGSRHMDTPRLAALADDFGFVSISVEYRLAPENPGGVGADDCYAALLWMTQHADELGIDSARVIVGGGSAGGCLAAATALMARDRGGPQIAGQLLMVPMLDDRNETVSSHQYSGVPYGIWSRESNVFSWGAVLGDAVGTDGVSPYAAPARAADLSNLPPAYIEVGAAEVFRDESITYATRIWATGGEAELHVWDGGFHGFAGFYPRTQIAQAANAARRSWLQRILSR